VSEFEAQRELANAIAAAIGAVSAQIRMISPHRPSEHAALGIRKRLQRQRYQCWGSTAPCSWGSGCRGKLPAAAFRSWRALGV